MHPRNTTRFVNESASAAAKQLASDIRFFIDRFAAISPNYDREDDDTKYTGPDPYELLRAAHELETKGKARYPHSEWSSGCYKPYTSPDGRKEHDELQDRLKRFKA